MTTDRPRRLAAATIALAATALLSACGTSFNAATNAQYQPAVGANQREGDVRLYNTLLVQNQDGTFSLSAGVVNTTDDEQSLTGAAFTPLTSDPDDAAGPAVEVEPSTDVQVPGDGMISIGAGGELAGLEIDGAQEGLYVTIVLTFDGAGDVTIDAPVVARTAEYSQVAAAPADDADAESDAGQGADDNEQTPSPEATDEADAQ